uniref:Haloacid dehalogenase-like hydrolase domain-containing protein 3 n=1 Tax=Sinocyclocheilus anshuiensis TaxID=1608454 RepID=A0A671N1N4_9TELE
MRGPVRWVLWDVKDTLLKVRRSVGEQYCSEAERAGLKLPAAQVETAFRQAYRQISRLFPNYGRAQGMNSQEWWTGLVRDTFAQCGVDDPALLDRLASNLYHNFSGPENWEVFPDSNRTLKFCTALGLKQEEAGVAKPDPGIFTQALVRCGVPASSVVHVGDHYVNDYLISRSLGIRGYLLDRQDCHGHLDVPPQHRLQSLDELPARLKLDAD